MSQSCFWLAVCCQAGQTGTQIRIRIQICSPFIDSSARGIGGEDDEWRGVQPNTALAPLAAWRGPSAVLTRGWVQTAAAAGSTLTVACWDAVSCGLLGGAAALPAPPRPGGAAGVARPDDDVQVRAQHIACLRVRAVAYKEGRSCCLQGRKQWRATITPDDV